MKELTITVSFSKPASKHQSYAITKMVKSEGAMWKYLREQRDSLTKEDVENGVRVIVTEDVNGAAHLFKDITFKMNSKGKIEMPNVIKETCRHHVEKARKSAKEKADFEALKKRASAEGRIGDFGEIYLVPSDLKEQN